MLIMGKNGRVSFHCMYRSLGDATQILGDNINIFIVVKVKLGHVKSFHVTCVGMF